MNKEKFIKGLFPALLVGIIVAIEEYFFPDMSFFIKLIINVLAAFVGYSIGETVISEKYNKN